MTGDPYRLAGRRREAARRGARVAALLVALVAAVPLLWAIDERFATAGARLPQAVSATWLRVGTVVACWLGLTAHGAVLRGEDRPVWSRLPVDPAQVVRQELRAALGAGAPVLLAAAVATLPTAWHLGPVAWGGGVVALGGLAAASILWSARALLTAVAVAEDPRWHDVLDRLRGANPRPQAAILWGLAPVVFGLGLMMVGVAEAVAAATPGALAVAVGWVWAVAGVGWRGVDRAAVASWFQATPVLEEIRARYAAVERVEDARRVALDGQADRVPAAIRPWFLAELRYGWRVQRTSVNGAWVVAGLAVLAGWTDDPAGPWRAGWLAAGIALAPGRVPVLGAAEEAPFLRRWLVDRPDRRAWARGLAVMGWSVTPLAGVVALVAVRAGGGAMVPLGLGLGGAILLAGVSAGLAARRSVAGYTTVAVASAAALVALATRGGA